MIAVPDDPSLRAALAARPVMDYPALPGRTNHERAGVLVPIVRSAEPWVLLTERASALRYHGGEVSFPGGRPEPGDADLAATALREAREEVGLERATILGPLSSVPLYTSDYRLVPFVASAPEQPLVPAPSEVARIVRAPLAELLAWPHVHGIPWTWEGTEVLSPIFEIDDRLVYGGTAYVLYELLEVVAAALGRTPPPLCRGPYEWEDVLGTG